MVRLIINVSSGEPVGCLPLALLGPRLKTEAREDVMSDDFAAYGESLTVRSPGPKAWWERAGGITHRGESFILADFEHAGTSHLYRFRKGGEGFPEADPTLERERNIASDRSYALAPLWGFLPRDLQTALEFHGRYRPRPYVRLSIAFNLLLSASVVITDMWRISVGVFGVWNVLRFAFALVLFGESVIRLLRHIQDGEISGSFLGVFVKPVYFMAVKGGPDEPGKIRRFLKGPIGSSR
ncbi:MAG: hypothetical protein NTW38_01910 [Candidatus Aminicenantes bacterium]|nr:hypothetical protein [Candidatus Aminicenantes bacterium]